MGETNRSAELSDREFEGVHFDNEKWSEKSITNAEFESCRFVGVSLAASELTSCQFKNCQFTRCDMTGIKLRGSTFSGNTFEDCRLTGIDWTTGVWPARPLQGANTFRRSDLSMSVFAGLHLAESVVANCRVHDVGFRQAKMAGADFQGSDFTNSDFYGADLVGARLLDTVGLVLDPRTCQMEGAIVDIPVAVEAMRALGAIVE